MADGSITVAVDVDNKKAVAELNKVEKKINDLEKELEKKQSERSAIVQTLDEARKAAIDAENEVDRLQKSLARSKEITSIEGERVSPQIYTQEVANQERLSVELSKQIKLRDEANKAAEKAEAADRKAVDAIQKVTESLDAQKTRAGDLTAEITASGSASARMAQKMDEVNQRMEKFTNRIKGLARRVFVFTLITTALRGLRTWLWNSIKANDQASAAIAKLKGALLTLAQPLVNVIIPAFTKLVELLSTVVAKAAAFVSGLFGATAEQSAQAAEQLYNEQQALKGVGSASKKAAKSLAGFDEINQLSGGTDSGSASTGIAPDFRGAVSAGIDGVVALFTGVALMALGAVLTFTGANILVGLGLMAAGAALVYSTISSNPALAAEMASKGLDAVLAVVGGALLAIGAVLAFSGASLGLGIGLMVAGAAALAPVIALNWGAITSFIQTNIDKITLAVGGALLVLGAVLTFTGANLPLGIGLLIAGAVSLIGAAALNEDAINAALKGPIGAITALVSGALLVLGAVLTFTGANIPLGIGLLVAGAAVLAKVATVNWDSIITALQGPIGAVTAMVGGALLVLGVILLFTGAGIPLGLGLILAGGASLAAAIAPNWDFILEKIKSVWEKIKAFWNKHIAPVFTAEWWSDLAKRAMNGLIGGIEKAINFILSGFGKFINWLTRALNKIPGVDIKPVDWGHVQLPRLASGAVIPPNREFLAVLGDQKQGTNIETPLSTMVEAFKQALAESGGGSNNRPIYLMLDRRELGRAVLEVGDQERVRVGVSLT